MTYPAWSYWKMILSTMFNNEKLGALRRSTMHAVNGNVRATWPHINSARQLSGKHHKWAPIMPCKLQSKCTKVVKTTIRNQYKSANVNATLQILNNKHTMFHSKARVITAGRGNNNRTIPNRISVHSAQKIVRCSSTRDQSSLADVMWVGVHLQYIHNPTLWTGRDPIIIKALCDMCQYWGGSLGFPVLSGFQHVSLYVPS